MLPDLSPAEAELAGQRAMREARLTARLVHQYAVTVFDVVQHDSQPCLVLQYVPSEPLSALLHTLGSLSPAEAARIGLEVGSALAEAHRLGIVHRDVKPGNVLIGDDGTARICDFGIAHALGEATLTGAGLVHGTPAYLSPEVARGGEPRYASDVFALGATLFAAVEGGPPFGVDENPVRLMHRIATGRPALPRRAGVLTPMLAQMLAVDPANRPTMAEVATRLAELVPRHGRPAQLPTRGHTTSLEEPQTPAAMPPPDAATRVVPPASLPTTRRPVPPHFGARLGPRARRSLLAVGLVVVMLVGLGVLLRVVGPLSRPASVTGKAPSASSGPPATTRATTTSTRNPRGSETTDPTTNPDSTPTTGPTGTSTSSSAPVYTPTKFVVPFTTAVPTWVAPTPATSNTYLVTWSTDGVAVRFLVPVTIYPPGSTRATDPPRNYLTYLRQHEGAGVRVGDVSQRTVDGRPATLLTVTATRRLAGSIGCPAAGMAPEQCHGLRPERRLRVAIVDVDGRALLIWLRNDQSEKFLKQSEQFDALLNSVRFN